jgi:transposase InsO family protein
MRIQSKYRGIRGFVTCYNDALRFRYMITEQAKHRAHILIFWEKHGLRATLDAFPVQRSTLYAWKQRWEQGGKKFEALNAKKTIPNTKRRRRWPPEVVAEIRRLRMPDVHPNLGSEKLHPLLKAFCAQQGIQCPGPRTIARIIADDPKKMRVFPKKVSHFGKVKKANRQKALRKPKDFKPEYPGHLVALDTVERFVHGCRRYAITFEDIYTRFSFAWSTKSHASLAAAEFFALCRRAFPHEYAFLFVLTDNGSEFKKHFAEELRQLHLIHFHTYPRTPKMNAHLERFNRTIQEEFIDYHASLLLDPDAFNRKLMDYLIFYNTERVHHAFKNRLSPVQFMLSLQGKNIPSLSEKSRSGWHYTVG